MANWGGGGEGRSLDFRRGFVWKGIVCKQAILNSAGDVGSSDRALVLSDQINILRGRNLMVLCIICV